MASRGRGRGRGGRGGFNPPSQSLLLLRRSAEECGLDSRNLRNLQDITRPPLFPDIHLDSRGGAAAAAAAAVDAKGPSDEERPSKRVKVQRSASTIYLISKQREIHHRIQNSVFHVKPSKYVPDVVRWSDERRESEQRRRGGAGGGGAGGAGVGGPPTSSSSSAIMNGLDSSNVLGSCLGGRKATELGRFVPDELASGQRLFRLHRAGTSGGARDEKLSLEELEARERSTLHGKSVSAGEGQQDGGEGQQQEGFEEVEEEEDDEVEDYAVDHYASEDDDPSDGGDGEATF